MAPNTWESPSHQHEAGIVSRNIVETPVANRLLPLRAVYKDRHDIAFIHENSVQIKVLHPDGRLQPVGARRKLNSRIRSAGVVGERARPTPWPKPADGARAQADATLHEVVPPQFLVLAVQSPPELRFMIAARQSETAFEVQERIVPLLSDGDYLHQPGHILAVDPNSRAVAVAAVRKNVSICRLKDLQSLSDQYVGDLKTWNPVQEVLHLKVDGYIQQMEFLHTGADHEHSLILMLVVVKERKTRMCWYHWDDREELRRVQPTNHPLEMRQREPHLLIPLQHQSSFLLIYSDHYCIVKGVLSRSLEVSETVRFQPEPQQRAGKSSAALPLPQQAWTAWSPDVQDDSWRENEQERLYVAREDGKVFYLQIENGEVHYKGCMCDFQSTLGSAFAVSEATMDLQGSYYLISAGDMGPGKVMCVNPIPRKQSMNPQETFKAFMAHEIDNWTPMIDATLCPSATFMHSARTSARKSLFVTGGRAPEHGCVARLSVGLRAIVKFRLVDGIFSQVTNAWTIYHTSGHIFVILSLISETSIIVVQAEEQEVAALDSNRCGADLTQTTLCVSNILGRHILQVTRESMCLLAIRDVSLELVEDYQIQNMLEGEIISASVLESTSFSLLACRDSSGSSLRLFAVHVGEEASHHESAFTNCGSYQMSSEATCIMLFDCVECSLAAVSSADGYLHVYSASREHGLERLAEFDFATNIVEGQSAICGSFSILKSAKQDPTVRSSFTLLCGMRDGNLIALQVVIVTDGKDAMFIKQELGQEQGNGRAVSKCQLSLKSNSRIGSTSVTLLRAQRTRQAECLASCGGARIRIRQGSSNDNDLEITEVFSDDVVHPLDAEPMISAMSLLTAPLEQQDQVDQFHAIFADDSFSLCTLDDDAHIVPNYLLVDGTPNRLLVSEQLSSLAISTQVTSNVYETSSSTARPKKRRKTAAEIQFIGPAYPGNDEDSNFTTTSFTLMPKEKIYCNLEIQFQDENRKKYLCHFVGTGIRHPDGKESGFLTILSPRKRKGSMDVRVLKRTGVSEPVYSITRVGPHELAFTAGKTLRICKLDMQTRSWSDLEQRELRSPGVHVTCAPTNVMGVSLIHASTARDSLVVYAYNENRGGDDEPMATLSAGPVCTDSQARPSLYHLNIHVPFDSAEGDAMDVDEAVENTHTLIPKVPNVTLIADKARCVTGLLVETGLKRTAARTLFEARLPHSIMRLCQGNIRPPWQDLSHKPRGVLTDDLIGTSIEGAMYHLAIVDQKATDLLMLLEDLLTFREAVRLHKCGRWTVLWSSKWYAHQQHHGAIPTRESMGHGFGVGAKNHVDGNLLVQMLKDDAMGTCTIRELLGELGSEGFAGPDRATFDGVARQALGLAEEVKGEELENAVRKWLKEVLRPVY